MKWNFVEHNTQPSPNKKQGPGGDRDPRIRINKMSGEQVDRFIGPGVSTKIRDQTEKQTTLTLIKPFTVKMKKSLSSIRPPFK